jgi:toxin secretion/phage lysis holin
MSDLAASLRDSLSGHNHEGLIGLSLSVLAYIFGGITYLLPILVFLIILDYLTGLLAAIISGRGFSVPTALKGAAKKMVYILFVVFAQLIDAVVVAVTYSGVMDVGNFHYLGLVVNVYLIGTECLSIAQNTADCGLPMPKPLLAFFKRIENIGQEGRHGSD